MDPLIEKLISLGLPIGGPLVWFICLFAFAFSPYNRLWTEARAPERKRIIGDLIRLGPRNRLRRSLTRRLDWIDAWLSSHELAAGRGPWRVAFSWDLLGLAMISALAYPILAALVQWLAGLPIRFGETELVAASAWQARLFFVFCGGIAACLEFSTLKSKLWLRRPSIIAAVIILSQTPRLAAWLGLEVPAATTAVVTVAFMATIGAAGAVAGAVTIAIAIAVLGLSASTFIFIIVVLLAAMVADDVFEERSRPPGFRILLLLLLLALLSAALPLRALITEAPLRALDIYLILMFGLFPLLNALADFASTGLTRLLLRAGLAQLDSEGIGPRQSRLWL